MLKKCFRVSKFFKSPDLWKSKVWILYVNPSMQNVQFTCSGKISQWEFLLTATHNLTRIPLKSHWNLQSLVTLCVHVSYDEALQSDLGDEWNKVQTVQSDSFIITSENSVSSHTTDCRFPGGDMKEEDWEKKTALNQACGHLISNLALRWWQLMAGVLSLFAWQEMRRALCWS